MPALRLTMLFVSAALLMTLAMPAQGGLISSVSTSPSSATNGFPFANAFAPNNGNSTAPNFSDNIALLKLDFSQRNAVDAIYSVDNSGTEAHPSGLTEYYLTGRIDNEGAKPWTGMRFQLGIGGGSAGAPSFPANLGGLDFDTPAKDRNVNLSVVSDVPPAIHEATLLSWPDTTLPEGSSMTYNIAVHVPDSSTGSGYNFTVRMTPLPEPASATLLLLGLGGLLTCRARGRRDHWFSNHVN